jgi:hypothetical protein
MGGIYGAIIYKQSFIKTGSDIQKADTGDIQRAKRSHKPTFIFTKYVKYAKNTFSFNTILRFMTYKKVKLSLWRPIWL